MGAVVVVHEHFAEQRAAHGHRLANHVIEHLNGHDRSVRGLEDGVVAETAELGLVRAVDVGIREVFVGEEVRAAADLQILNEQDGAGVLDGTVELLRHFKADDPQSGPRDLGGLQDVGGVAGCHRDLDEHRVGGAARGGGSDGGACGRHVRGRVDRVERETDEATDTGGRHGLEAQTADTLDTRSGERSRCSLLLSGVAALGEDAIDTHELLLDRLLASGADQRQGGNELAAETEKASELALVHRAQFVSAHLVIEAEVIITEIIVGHWKLQKKGRGRGRRNVERGLPAVGAVHRAASVVLGALALDAGRRSGIGRRSFGDLIGDHLDVLLLGLGGHAAGLGGNERAEEAGRNVVTDATSHRGAELAGDGRSDTAEETGVRVRLDLLVGADLDASTEGAVLASEVGSRGVQAERAKQIKGSEVRGVTEHGNSKRRGVDQAAGHSRTALLPGLQRRGKVVRGVEKVHVHVHA